MQASNFGDTFDQLSFEFFMKFSQKMPLNFFYTKVQKSQKWPKTQIKGGPALIFNLWWLNKSQQQWLFDGASDLECPYVLMSFWLCGEKQRPHAEERSAGKNFIPDQTTAVETTSWRAWSRCRTPAAETLQCFRRIKAACWTCRQHLSWKRRVREREEQAIPSLKLSSSFAVRLFCALSACFMHVFSLLELLTEAVHAVHVSWARQCGCHEGLKPKVGTPWYCWWGSWRSRPRHRRSTKNVKGDHRPLIQRNTL